MISLGHILCPGEVITMLSSAMAAKPTRPSRSRKPSSSRRPRGAAPKPDGGIVVPDGFYRDMVWNLRNGVVAITRDGRVAVMNDIAYRVLGLTPRARDIGGHFAEVLKDVPDVLRIVAGSFELSHLPNRAELRLKNTEKVIGYTPAHPQGGRRRHRSGPRFLKARPRVG